MPVPVFTFAAWSNTGKTTYLEKLIPLLKRAGLRVAVVKHDAHDFQLDQPGKDTWRFARAGADVVAIASGSRYAMMACRPVTLEEILRQTRDADLCLVDKKDAPRNACGTTLLRIFGTNSLSTAQVGHQARF